MNINGPVLRIFEVRSKPNCVDDLLENFASTSLQVINGEPGNLGCFFGRCVEHDGVVIFVSVWKDLASIKAKFGDKWQDSYLPSGYLELIEDCSVRHFDLTDGWHVDGL